MENHKDSQGNPMSEKRIKKGLERMHNWNKPKNKSTCCNASFSIINNLKFCDNCGNRFN